MSRPPCQQKRGGVSILYKSFLPLRILNVQYLQGSIFFELKIAEKAWNFFSLYTSPSQIQDDFKAFTENLESNLKNGAKNPLLVVSIRDFMLNQPTGFVITKLTLKETQLKIKHPGLECTRRLKNQLTY